MTFNPTTITFYNGPNATEKHTLTGGTLISTVNWVYMEFEVTFDDVFALKSLEALATIAEDTYISITSDLIQDMNGNNVNPIYIEPMVLDDNATNATYDTSFYGLLAWHYEADITGNRSTAFNIQ